ncbi:MAG: formylglycine-generating enzyme family protein [Victivallales bacterium]|nr:formylglycine-generating enzyme family protein [Victivallales bacterium]
MKRIHVVAILWAVCMSTLLGQIQTNGMKFGRLPYLWGNGMDRGTVERTFEEAKFSVRLSPISEYGWNKSPEIVEMMPGCAVYYFHGFGIGSWLSVVHMNAEKGRFGLSDLSQAVEVGLKSVAQPLLNPPESIDAMKDIQCEKVEDCKIIDQSYLNRQMAEKMAMYLGRLRVKNKPYRLYIVVLQRGKEMWRAEFATLDSAAETKEKNGGKDKPGVWVNERLCDQMASLFLGNFQLMPPTVAETAKGQDDGSKQADCWERFANAWMNHLKRRHEEAIRKDLEFVRREEKMRKIFPSKLMLPEGESITLIPVVIGGTSNRFFARISEQEDYWIGETEVTQKQYATIMKNVRKEDGTLYNPNPSGFNGDGLPVEQVSWDDAKAFCKELNRVYKYRIPAGYVFDLPTTAQWEFAAGGGFRSKGYEFCGSNNLDEVAWYYVNSGPKQLDEKNWSVDNRLPEGGQTHPVGMKKPNELGLYDMMGNVLEWCQEVDIAKQGDKTVKLCKVRGASWTYLSKSCTLGGGNGFLFSTERRNDLGFRIALVPVQE